MSFTETNKYIELNHRGTPVLRGKNLNVVVLGQAHEHGMTESPMLEQYDITRAQLHAALSYYYEHRDTAVQEYLDKTEALLADYGVDSKAKLEELRRRIQDK